MKAFDPIAAGFTAINHTGISSVTWRRGRYYLSIQPKLITLSKAGRLKDDVLVYIPASFDHNTAVALLRANGADIPEPDHAD